MDSDKQETFHNRLYSLIDEFVHFVYEVTRKFPKEELFATTSQLRRAAMSVMLNYQEGFARRKRLVKINFYEISFGSCKESKYLIDFAHKEKWISREKFDRGMHSSDQIASMLWKTIEGLDNENN